MRARSTEEQNHPRRWLAPRWWRTPASPAGRAGVAVLAVALFAGVLVAAVGVGYGVSRPFLGDGSAFLAKGHTVVHVNSESGKSDAEVAQQLATGKEELQTVRLPDGRVAVVNKTTGTVTIIDAATMTPTGPAVAAPTPNPQIQAVATTADGYLVDSRDNTVQRIVVPGQAAAPAVPVPAGIQSAVPSGESIWVLTKQGEVVEVNHDRAVRTVKVGEPATGLTLADGHPVAVTGPGAAYVVDAAQPRGIGDLGLSGVDVALGSAQGAGRHVLGVDRRSGRFAALDPRTGGRVALTLAVPRSPADLGGPIELAAFAYVPDYAGPSLWRIGLGAGAGAAKRLDVPGHPGPFSLQVIGGKVWANNQYDQRGLVVDAAGQERYVDKGAGPDVTDSQGTSGGATGPDPRPAETGAPPPGPAGATPAPATIPVPAFPAGTKRAAACAELVRLKLQCRTVAVGDSGTRPTDEVIDTDPKAGTRLPPNAAVTVHYVGPLKTPNVLGLAHDAACALLQSFTCVSTVDAAPAASPDRLGKVSAQDPKPDAPLARGAKVTITYPNSIALPPLSGQAQGEACTRLTTTYGLKCEPVEGDPGVGAGKTPGQVYDQQPPAGTVVTVGATIRVVYYRGTAPVGGYVGASAATACAAVTAAGFTCQAVEGVTAAGTGQQPGIVYQQAPAAGTTLDLGQPVTVTYLSGNNDLPDYHGAAADAACGDIAARGFQCNAVAQPFPSTNVVEAQDQGAGRYPIGSVVTIHYSPWGLVQYSIYQKNDDNVWVLRPTGNVPAGYGRQAFVVGTAYAPGTPIPGAHNVNGFFCTAGSGKCNGLNVNHFYSLVGSYPDPLWQGPTSEAVFMACEAGAGRGIYRVWTAGSPRYYNITSNPAGWAGVELLGCVW